MPAWAITEASVKALKAGDVIELPIPPADKIMKLAFKSMIDFTSGKAHWYMITGTAEGEEETIFVDFTEQVPDVSFVVKELAQRDLKVNAQTLEKFDAQGSGKITYDGKDYIYEDSDDVEFVDNGQKDVATYFSFAVKRDDTDSILVFQWDEKTIEGFLLKSVNEKLVKVIQ